MSFSDLLAGGSAWWIVPVSLLVFGATFGLLPGVILRLLVQLYPKGHPRREELFGELYGPDMGRVERFEWVFQQLETAFREGPAMRRRARAARRIDSAPTSNLEEAKTGNTPAVVGEGCMGPYEAAWSMIIQSRQHVASQRFVVMPSTAGGEDLVIPAEEFMRIHEALEALSRADGDGTQDYQSFVAGLMPLIKVAELARAKQTN